MSNVLDFLCLLAIEAAIILGTYVFLALITTVSLFVIEKMEKANENNKKSSISR